MASKQLPTPSLESQAIENARSAFDSLPHSNAVFQACINQAQTIPEVVEAIRQRYRFYKRRKFTRLLEKFQQHTLWLQNISSAVDVAVQTSTNIGCPLWAPIKFVLIVSGDHARAAEEILKMIDTISDDLPRFEIYQRLQPDPVLKEALLNIFTDVVLFSIRAWQYFGGNTFVRLIKLIRYPFNERFGDILNRLHRHARAVDQTAVAIELLRASDFRNQIVDQTAVATGLQRAEEFRNESERRGRQTLMLQYESWLKPLNVRAILENERHLRLKGTCKWIFTNPQFVKWREGSISHTSDRSLCIYGPHGCGKSTLASSIADELGRGQALVLFYSFSGINTNRQATEGLPRTFLWLLLQGSDERGHSIMEKLMENGQPTTSELWQALKAVIGLVDEDIYCIIDGVDECDDPPKLLSFIKELGNTHPTSRITVLGRPGVLRTVIAATPLVIEMSSEMISEDIDKFIKAKIEGSAVLRQPHIRDAVFHTLQKKSDGMFLWVKLMVDGLSRPSATSFDVGERLRSLPCGLEAAYRLLLLRLIEKLQKTDLDLARKLLAFTTIACRSLDLNEVRYACALDSLSSSDSTNSTLDEHLIPQSEFEQAILQVCGDFVSISNGTLCLVHFSVKEFLTRHESEWLNDDDGRIASFRVDTESTHRNLGSLCIEYLGMGDYGFPWNDATTSEELEARHPFLRYASTYMVSHLMRSGNPCPDIFIMLRNFLDSGKCASWLEYMSLFTMERGSAEIIADFGIFIPWLQKFGADGLEVLGGALKMFLGQELTRRAREFGDHDRRTEQWQSFLSIMAVRTDDRQSAEHSQSVARATDGPLPVVAEASTQDLARILDRHRGSQMLPLNLQVDLTFRLLSYLRTANALTDPLKLLFCLILQKAAGIHAYLLVAIALFYCKVGKLDEALEMLGAASNKVEHRNVPTKFIATAGMCAILCKKKKYEEAEATGRRNLKACQDVLGIDHHATLIAAYCLAYTLRKQQKFAEAAEFYRHTFTGTEKILGANNPITLRTLEDLARVLPAAEAEAITGTRLLRNRSVRSRWMRDSVHRPPAGLHALSRLVRGS